VINELSCLSVCYIRRCTRGMLQDWASAGAEAPGTPLPPPAPTAWSAGRSALAPPWAGAGPSHQLPALQSLTPPQSARGLAPASSGSMPSAADSAHPGRSLIDVGVLLGDGSRIGWGPGACFAQNGEQATQLLAVSTGWVVRAQPSECLHSLLLWFLLW